MQFPPHPEELKNHPTHSNTNSSRPTKRNAQLAPRRFEPHLYKSAIVAIPYTASPRMIAVTITPLTSATTAAFVERKDSHTLGFDTNR